MSNRPKINLTKLAEQLTGAKAGRADDRPALDLPAFPRIPLDRFKELLDEANQDEEAVALRATLKARLVLPVSGMHLKSRPQAGSQATDGTAAA